MLSTSNGKQIMLASKIFVEKNDEILDLLHFQLWHKNVVTGGLLMVTWNIMVYNGVDKIVEVGLVVSEGKKKIVVCVAREEERALFCALIPCDVALSILCIGHTCQFISGDCFSPYFRVSAQKKNHKDYSFHLMWRWENDND